MDKNRLWGRIIRHHRIVMSETVEMQDGEFEEALLTLCRRFDIARPLQLPKHDREFAEFGHTFYTAEHFPEPIAFDRLEIEFIPAHGEARAAHKRTPLMDA